MENGEVRCWVLLNDPAMSRGARDRVSGVGSSALLCRSTPASGTSAIRPRVELRVKRTERSLSGRAALGQQLAELFAVPWVFVRYRLPGPIPFGG